MALGYSGFAQVLDGSTVITVLSNSAGINPELNPISSNASMGLGWKNAAQTTHYANGVITYRGSIGFDLQANGVWALLNKWALTERVYAKAFRHSPDGTVVFDYGTGSDTGFGANTEANVKGGWCESFGITASSDSTVSCNLGVLALYRAKTAGSGYFTNQTGFTSLGANCTQFSATNPLNPTQANTSPIPFWKTKAEILFNGAALANDPEAIQWNVDLSNNTQVIKTCNGLTVNNYGVASAVVQGPMNVSGSVELYRHSGVWDPILDNPITGATTSFRVTINAGASDYVILVPAVRLTGDAYDNSPGSPVNRRFSFEGLGGSCGAGSAVQAPMIMT